MTRSAHWLAVAVAMALVTTLTESSCTVRNSCICDWVTSSCSGDTISVANQFIGGKINATWFDLDNAQNYHTLTLQNCGITGIADNAFTHLGSLTSLCLLNNQISTPLSTATLAGISMVSYIDLGRNQITSVASNAFKVSSQLTYLSLGSNAIAVIEDGAFNGLSMLSNLDISNNYISSISSTVFANLTQLIHLNLAVNSITTMQDGAYNALSRLTSLDFGVNRITSISSTVFANLSKLNFLNIGTNAVTKIQGGAFNFLTSVTTMYIDTNQLSSLPDQLLDNCMSLSILGFHANPMLMRLPYGIFRNLTLLSNIWTYKPPTQIVCWPAPPPSQLLIQGYSSNLCAPDGSATYGTAVSNGYLALSCPAKSFISGVTFASFGTPVGVSGRYQLGTCAFNSTVAAVSSACIKHQSCLLMASTTAFGPNQCPSTPQSSLSLSVAVNCTSNATTKRTAAARNTFNLRTVPSHKSSVSYGQRQLKVLSTQGRTLLTTLRTTVSAPRATTRHSQRGTVLATLRPTVPTPLSTTRHLTGSRSDEMQSGTQDISGTATGRSNISGPFILIACTVTVSIVGIASLIQLWRLKQQPDSSGAAQRQAPSSVMLPTSAKLFSSPGQARASNTEFPSGTASVYSYFYPSNRR